MKNKRALAAGLATGVLGSGASYGGHKLGTSLRKDLRKKNEKYDRKWKKVGDKARVGRGLMTEEEYRKKWYNK